MAGSPRFEPLPLHGEVMRNILASSFIALLLSAQGSFAQPVSVQLHDIGYDACTQAMQEQLPDVDGAHYRRIVDASSMNRVEFCNCVAEDFSTGGKDDLSLLKSTKWVDHLAMMSVMAMTGCLPEDYSDPDVTDGDLDMDTEDFAYDESDVNLCKMAFEGDFPLPGFDGAAIARRVKSNGQTVDDVCICSARDFTVAGEALQIEIEDADNPNLIYSSTLAGAINTCTN
jgi:hypothetical protein